MCFQNTFISNKSIFFFLFCHLQFALAFHDCEFLQNSSSERGQELAITAHASFLYAERK